MPPPAQAANQPTQASHPARKSLRHAFEHLLYPFIACVVLTAALWLADYLGLVSPHFTPKDIRDASSLARKLKEKSDPVSSYLMNQLAPQYQEVLLQYPTNSANAAKVQDIILIELNRLLSGPSIYDQGGFFNLHVDPKLYAVADSNPQGVKLVWFNRRFLEWAYSKELAPRHWFHIGVLLKDPILYIAPVLVFLVGVSIGPIRRLSRSWFIRELRVLENSRELYTSIGNLRMAAIQAGPAGFLGHAEVAKLVDQLSSRLNPANGDEYRREQSLFDEVVKALKECPTQMYFTDRRTPEDWELNNDLHRFNIALARSILHRPQSWVAHFNGTLKLQIPELVCRAVSQCLQNLDSLYQMRPIGHARRWIGCKTCFPVLDAQQQGIADALFGRKDWGEMRPVAQALFAQHSNEHRRRCKACRKAHPRQCAGIDFRQIANFLKDNTRPRTSIYELSNLYTPASYWPPTYLNDYIAAMPVKAKLQVAATANPGLNDHPSDSMNCFRVVFWKRKDIEKHLIWDIVELWDRVLCMPVFWVDPDAVFPTQYAHLKTYFVTTNCDFLIVNNSQSNPPVNICFRTTLRPSLPSQSQNLTADAYDELKTNIEALLHMIIQPRAAKSNDAALLAPHAQLLS